LEQLKVKQDAVLWGTKARLEKEYPESLNSKDWKLNANGKPVIYGRKATVGTT